MKGRMDACGPALVEHVLLGCRAMQGSLDSLVDAARDHPGMEIAKIPQVLGPDISRQISSPAL
ncbi:MAG: hypothetical protein LW833_03395 [Hyphomicrobiales bacterium]|jgi:hypothetical protein|nr:hypothetical protein [Hyphomicrobiales bacterium]